MQFRLCNTFIAVIFSVVSLEVSAQTYSPFERAYSEPTLPLKGRSITQTVQETSTVPPYQAGFVIAGRLGPVFGVESAHLVRINESGNKIWDRVYANPTFQCNSEAMCIIPSYPKSFIANEDNINNIDSGFVFTGYYQGFYNETLAEGNKKRLVIWGVNSVGATTWTRAFTKPNEIIDDVEYTYNAYGQHIANINLSLPIYVAVGFLEKIRVSDNAVVDHQIMVVQYNRSNNSVNSRVYETGPGYFDKAYCVTPQLLRQSHPASDDAIITVTRATNPDDLNPETLLLKIDLRSATFGNILWSNKYIPYYGNTITYAKSVHTEHVWGDGRNTFEGYVTTGYHQYLPGGPKNVFLLKTDLLGNSVWSRTISANNDPFANDEGFSVKEDIYTGYNLNVAGSTYIQNDKQGLMLNLNDFGGTANWPGYHSGYATSFDDFEDLLVRRHNNTYILPAAVCAGTTGGFSANDDIYAVRLNKQFKKECSQNDATPTNTILPIQKIPVEISQVAFTDSERTVYHEVISWEDWTNLIPCYIVGRGRAESKEIIKSGNEQTTDNVELHINPNPVSKEAAKLTLNTLVKGYTEVVIYNSQGKVITSLLNELLEPGNYEISIPSDLGSGVYLCKVVCGGIVYSKSFTVVK
ncbi:MAG: T9SS type A sorting domain-containing protein [Bacteroidota bacterium]